MLAYSRQWYWWYMPTEAYAAISAVATHINNHIKQQDNSIRMLSIQKSLSGPLAPRLIAPGRYFIKDGMLKKVYVMAKYTFNIPIWYLSNWACNCGTQTTDMQLISDLGVKEREQVVRAHVLPLLWHLAVRQAKTSAGDGCGSWLPVLLYPTAAALRRAAGVRTTGRGGAFHRNIAHPTA